MAENYCLNGYTVDFTACSAVQMTRHNVPPPCKPSAQQWSEVRSVWWCAVFWSRCRPRKKFFHPCRRASIGPRRRYRCSTPRATAATPDDAKHWDHACMPPERPYLPIRTSKCSLQRRHLRPPASSSSSTRRLSSVLFPLLLLPPRAVAAGSAVPGGPSSRGGPRTLPSP